MDDDIRRACRRAEVRQPSHRQMASKRTCRNFGIAAARRALWVLLLLVPMGTWCCMTPAMAIGGVATPQGGSQIQDVALPVSAQNDTMVVDGAAAAVRSLLQDPAANNAGSAAAGGAGGAATANTGGSAVNTDGTAAAAGAAAATTGGAGVGTDAAPSGTSNPATGSNMTAINTGPVTGQLGSSAQAQLPASTPPPPSVIHMQVPVSQRCVVIFGTGRSGSTSLTDALNQIPTFLIRGEQESAYFWLFQAWKSLRRTWVRSDDYRRHIDLLEWRHKQGQGQGKGGAGKRVAKGAHMGAAGEDGAEEDALVASSAAAYLSFNAVKGLYEVYALQKKLPWFNDLHPARVQEAVRAFYSLTYGYHGHGFVSGFKEVRFAYKRAFPPGSTYKDFASFASFLRTMCLDVKFILNSRASASVEDNKKLTDMMRRTPNKDFEDELQATHDWYDRYTAEHPDHAFRVFLEDMIDPQTNATLARNLLTFLGEDPSTPISFDRMPTLERSVPTRRRRALSQVGAAEEEEEEEGEQQQPGQQRAWGMRRRQLREGASGRVQPSSRQAGGWSRLWQWLGGLWKPQPELRQRREQGRGRPEWWDWQPEEDEDLEGWGQEDEDGDGEGDFDRDEYGN